MMGISKKAVIIISVAFLLLIPAVINISAESIWEGSAAMGRYGEFPASGLYGASNSFPQNSYVEVENVESGKRTRLIIVDRLSNTALMMLVSGDAAQELGIYQNDIARIKVRLLSSGVAERAMEYDDLAYNPDPDINPAAALISPEELAYNEISEAEAESPEPVSPETESGTAETQTEEIAEPENEAETVAELPEADKIDDAEALFQPEDVSELPSDAPEKPFDWPDDIIEESEPEPEPLYLTMDALEESLPAEPADEEVDNVAVPEAVTLWPDDSTPEPETEVQAQAPGLPQSEDFTEAVPADSAEGIEREYDEVPEAELALVSSGLSETVPEYTEDSSFVAAVLPEITGKQSEEAEYITGATGYKSPEANGSAVAETTLPAPEPEIPEEVVSALVGDSAGLAYAAPEAEEAGTGYQDVPQVMERAEEGETYLQPDLADAVPADGESPGFETAAVPVVPGAEDRMPVEIADGYLSPEDDYTAEIEDYPDYTESGLPAEIPKTDDGLAYSEAPEEPEEAEALAELPEPGKVPEPAEAVETVDISEETPDGQPEVDELEQVLPEYDENLEVTLEPAEERPPVLDEEDTALAEAAPSETPPAGPGTEVDHLPDVTAEAEAGTAADVAVETSVEITETVAAETAPEQQVEAAAEPVSVPEQIVMAEVLERKRHYLQLGAFKEKNSALNAAGKLERGYPVTILTDSGGAGTSYKLLVGPLTADESGILLYNFRAGGYSDAFIRRIE